MHQIGSAGHPSRHCLYLPLRRVQRPPVVGPDLEQLIKLKADILNGELEHVPEASQVGGHWLWMSIGVLTGKRERKQQR